MTSSRLPAGLVAIPAEEKMWVRSAHAILSIQAATPRVNFSWQVAPTTIAEKRNAGAKLLLADDDQRWLLCLDSDMAPPPDVIHRLWRTAEEVRADLVQAGMVAKRPPHRPIGDRITHRGEPSDPLRPFSSDPDVRWENATAESLVDLQGVVEMDMGGTGCLLVRRRVFEELRAPWFVGNEIGSAEDSNFTLRATLAGFKLVMDPRVRVGHVSCYAYGLEDGARAERAARET